MSARTQMMCPKCEAPMRVIERSGVTIERCTECGGVFLDRGELERLMKAEGEYVDRAYREDREDRDGDRFDDEYQGHGGRRKKKRRGFLEDLLDFG